MNSLFRSRSGTQHNISFEIAVRCTQNTYILRANHYSYLSQQGSCSKYNVLVMQRLHAPPTHLSSRVSLWLPLRTYLSLSPSLYSHRYSIIKDLMLQNSIFVAIIIAITISICLFYSTSSYLLKSSHEFTSYSIWFYAYRTYVFIKKSNGLKWLVSQCFMNQVENRFRINSKQIC